MSYGMIFAIAVVLLLGWLHSSRKEAARQDVEWPAKTPADRGKSVNGGRGDVVFRWELLQSEPDGSASSLGEGGCLRSRLGGS